MYHIHTFTKSREDGNISDDDGNILMKVHSENNRFSFAKSSSPTPSCFKCTVTYQSHLIAQ